MRNGWAHIVQKVGLGRNLYVARAIQVYRISLFLGALDHLMSLRWVVRVVQVRKVQVDPQEKRTLVMHLHKATTFVFIPAQLEVESILVSTHTPMRITTVVQV